MWSLRRTRLQTIVTTATGIVHRARRKMPANTTTHNTNMENITIEA